jgi:UDP-N-acetylglucosamine acyltransferase
MIILHPTAIVSERSRLAAEVAVGPYAVVEPDTDIGEGSEIRAHAVIKRFTSLGPQNVVHEGAVLGGEPQDVRYTECESYVRIGARNRIREGVTIQRGSSPSSATILGSDCYLMVNAHVAHDCRIGDGVILANNVALAGHVEIQSRAFLSGGVVVHQFCRVGRLAMIGGNSKIIQDCMPFVITDGVPARARGLNLVGIRRAGYGSDDIRILKQAYRVLFRSGLSLDHALASLCEMTHPLADLIRDFASTSSRGFCRE